MPRFPASKPISWPPPAGAPAPAGRPSDTTPGQAVALTLIRAYQLLVSPFIPGGCRFSPSCSAYASEAVERHGVVKGAWLGLKRLLRCHPFGASGHDPVPAAHADHAAHNLGERP